MPTDARYPDKLLSRGKKSDKINKTDVAKIQGTKT